MNLYRVVLLILFFVSTISYSALLAENYTPIVTDTRVKTLVYNPNSVFDLKVHHKYQSYIQLSKNEIIKRIAIGDGASWRIVPAGNKIFIRPLESNARTNLIIDTNKFSYTFDLIALESIKIKDMTYIVRFYYPDDNDFFEKDTSVELLEDKIISSKYKLSKNKGEKVNHNYSFHGHEELKPIDVFDNGKLTFFKFADLTPKIFIVKKDGSEYSTEMISYEDFIVINGVYEEISLRYQDKKLTIIKGKSHNGRGE